MRDDLQDLVDEVSRLLAAPATLEDRDFTMLAFCAHGEPEGGDPGTTMDAVRARSILGRGSTPEVRRRFEEFGIADATDPLRVPADPAAGILTRLCLPVRASGRLQGYLWLLDGGRTDVGDPAAPGLAEAVALAAEAGRLLAEGRPGTADLSAALRAVLTGAAPGRAVRELTDALGGDRTTVTLVALRPAAGGLPTGWTPPGAGAVTAVLPAGADAVAVAVLLPLSRDADTRPAGALSAAALAKLPAGSTAGLAAPRRGCQELPAQWHEARTAARVAAVDPRLAPAASWSELGAWRQVAALPGPDTSLARLLTDPVLTGTAEVWLDCAGSPQRAAAQLCIHRQTLYYRLGRIAELTGLDLADGADRLLLHLGVRAARLSSADPFRNPPDAPVT
ncbi:MULTISPECIES: PucR family transcriptional regulator [unclassified Modestobacter]|uniref:PucR family transcriptional regulator n=1 Tax=unclassified Modestobacter TaxID=2643866 RepID=UPI0022AB3233|nr:MULTISPECIES: helix-turn-helix domain-containing protein [unclassified Modestobacter]MCZ2824417.1 helix-turn-helix domain-containing protein [Modestobacter sp. VKM Ac-2981]MCZ2854055.1 helix-turn-helix domain-containing protein [Modestobacter sp. VKM Ac-2982]